jgi:uncharacterized membrane protein YidH (DUF202 family)
MNEGKDVPSPSESMSTRADPRVDMAAYRTELALDRTTLAWIRTTLTMASFGFGMVAFFRSRQIESPNSDADRLHQGAIRMGTSLLILGIAATMLACLVHWSALRKLRRGQAPNLHPWSLSLTLAVLFSIVSLAGLWALFVG